VVKGGQSGETPEPPCCSRRRSKRVVRWSVGGDPRAPLLLTQEVSAGGQSGETPEPPLLLTLGVSSGGLSSSAAASSGASGGFDVAPSTF